MITTEIINTHGLTLKIYRVYYILFLIVINSVAFMMSFLKFISSINYMTFKYKFWKYWKIKINKFIVKVGEEKNILKKIDILYCNISLLYNINVLFVL